jgi:DNA-binding beta-propeller fold protein YncE
MHRNFFGVLATSLIVAVGPALAAEVDFKIIAHYKLEGPGKAVGLALDTEARRIYLAHGANVEILNADSGAPVGQIGTGAGASAVALIPDMKRGFVANSEAGTITVLDTESGKALKTIRSTGKAPGAVIYDDGSKRVFVSNHDSGSVTALDCDSGKVLGTVELAGKAGQLTANGYGRLFVAAPGTNLIHVIDTTTLKALGDMPAGTGQDCTGLALDPVGRRLFVACANGRVAVVDTDNGFTFEDLAGGRGPGAGVFTFLPAGKGGWKGAAFMVNADGTLTAVKMNAYISYSVGASAKLPTGIQSIAFDSKTHNLLVPAPVAGGNRWELLVISQ